MKTERDRMKKMTDRQTDRRYQKTNKHRDRQTVKWLNKWRMWWYEKISSRLQQPQTWDDCSEIFKVLVFWVLTQSPPWCYPPSSGTESQNVASWLPRVHSVIVSNIRSECSCLFLFRRWWTWIRFHSFAETSSDLHAERRRLFPPSR